MLFCVVSFAQTTVKGKIIDNSGLPLPGANIVVVGTSSGTVSDFDGIYALTVDQEPPFSIRVSYTGFEDQTIEITTNNQTVDVTMQEGNELDEVIISASRTPERIFESPVTVERFGLKEIKNTASPDFYGGLENLKGVDINTNSLTFKSINTRGFATFANTRFMQLVDGMDNSAPALNFPLGNLLGMVETDVQSVELLPGASSALYGANAFNGILFMRSKNPFDHQGIRGYIKQGITSQEAAGDNSYTDLGISMAYKFSDKFAAKVNFGYLKGTDWFATNYDDKNMSGGTRESNINYNGVNVYGDEVTTNIREASGGLGIIPDVSVSRTGYLESELTDYNAENVKADWGLYFRPWADDFEIQYVGKVGTGSTIYQGAQRYRIDGFSLQQHKIEVKNDNFFVRGYITSDKAGDTFVMDVLGPNLLNAWKSHQDWYGDYIQTYAGIELSGNPQGLTESQKHDAARAVAETGRPQEGSEEFNRLLDQVTSDTNFITGAGFKDNSKIYHSDANYNFGDLFQFAEIQVGGSYRTYRLNSFGTIYADAEGPIKYSELGVYTQLQRSLELNEDLELKLTGSVRYDKSELFDGFFSPRISAGLTVNDNHNFRASFQTGFRNPDTQALYIGLQTNAGTLIGGATDIGSRYERPIPTSNFAQANLGLPSTVVQNGAAAYNNSLLSSIEGALGDPSLNTDGREFIGNSNFVDPEQVSSFELGYRGKLNGFIIDASAYYSIYDNFLANENVVAPLYGDVSNFDLTGYDPTNPSTVAGLNSDTQQILAALQNGDFAGYQTYTNTEETVNSYGAAVAVSKKVFDGFDLSANYTWSRLDFDVAGNPDFQTNFNTPEHKVKLGFGKTEVFNNIGFNVAWRWSDNYFWESSFGSGEIPAFNVLDAQVNYKIPSLKTTLKAGATNLFGDEYFTAFGTGYIGQQYYLALTINNL